MRYKLLSAEEKYIPHYGLRVDAVYQMESEVGILCFPQKVRFWHRHAPVELEADLIEVKLDVPHVWVEKDGLFKRTASGHLMITQNEVVFCPKTKDGTYFMGYSPQEQKAQLLTRLMPCKWARPED